MDNAQNPRLDDVDNSNSSGSESEGTEIEESSTRYNSGLKDIKTIREYYEERVLNAPKEGSALYPANAAYMERVSLV
jgi:hypothetical protein